MEASAKVDAELKGFEQNSAHSIQRLQDGIEEASAAVERWTDNLDTGRKYLRKKFQSERQVLDQLFPEMD